MASRSFILDTQIVWKGKHKKIVPGFYMTFTKMADILIWLGKTLTCT